MCGIAGFIKTSSARLDTVQILHNLSQSIQHRGPDAAGFGIWGKGKKVEITSAIRTPDSNTNSPVSLLNFLLESFVSSNTFHMFPISVNKAPSIRPRILNLYSIFMAIFIFASLNSLKASLLPGPSL